MLVIPARAVFKPKSTEKDANPFKTFLGSLADNGEASNHLPFSLTQAGRCRGPARQSSACRLGGWLPGLQEVHDQFWGHTSRGVKFGSVVKKVPLSV